MEGFLGEEGYVYKSTEDPEELERNVWSHVALTFDGAHMRLYVDGELVDTTSAEGAVATSGPLSIGCSAEFEDNYEGLIDEVRLYDRALGEEEIAAALRVPLPVVETTDAYGVDATEAVLVGVIGSHNEETEYRFEYGTTAAYGNSVPETNEDVVVSDEDREVEYAIFDLDPKTTYHYRVLATSASGTVFGEDQILTTGTAFKTNQQLADERTVLLNNTNWRASDFVNIQWSGDTPETLQAATMNRIEATGAKMLRIGIANADANTDTLFKLAAERDITILPGLGGGLIPKNGKDGVREEWRKTLREVVEDYGHEGKFWKEHPNIPQLVPVWWEIWNEQNYGPTASVGKRVIPVEYGDLLDESAQVFNKYDKKAKLLFGGLLSVERNSPKEGKPRKDKMPVGEYIREVDDYLKKVGNQHAYQALSLHPYAFAGHKEDPVPNTSKEVEIIREKVRNNIKVARAALDRAGGDNKKIWITELGWPVKTSKTPDDGSHYPVSEQMQQELLNLTFNMVKSRSGTGEQSYGLANVFYYNVEDVVDGILQTDEEDSEEFGNWAYRSGLREDEDAGVDDAGEEYGEPGSEPGLCRKSWYAFQNQAQYEGQFKGLCP
jgi:Concanavalin A-like lectin/glucanases superfamily